MAIVTIGRQLGSGGEEIAVLGEAQAPPAGSLWILATRSAPWPVRALGE